MLVGKTIKTVYHCLQWGFVKNNGNTVQIVYPISYTQKTYANVGNDFNDANNPAVLSFYNQTLNGCICSGRRMNDSSSIFNTFGTWISIGI